MHQPHQLAEVGADRGLQRRPARGGDRGGHRDVTIEQRKKCGAGARRVAFFRLARHLDQLVGDARQRRHHDDGCTLGSLVQLPAHDSDQPVDRVRIGHRRAAEFHHHTHGAFLMGRTGRKGGKGEAGGVSADPARPAHPA